MSEEASHADQAWSQYGQYDSLLDSILSLYLNR